MNTLTALTLSATFAASLYSTTATADDVTQQIRSALQQPLVELRQNTQQQARLALQKTVIALQARHTAEADAADMLAAQRPAVTEPAAE